MAVRKLTATLLFLLMPCAALAFKGEIHDQRLKAKNTDGIEVLIDYDIKWQIGHLLGEPTRNLFLRWHLSDVPGDQWFGQELQQMVPDGFQFTDLPDDIRETIRLYDVEIRLGFTPDQNDNDLLYPGYVTFDAGSPAKAGEQWSYNVSGSPDWSEFMTQYNGTPLSEEDAKALMTLPELYGRVDHLSVTAKVNLGDALRWLRTNFDKGPTEVTLAGAKQQLDVLSEELGLPVDGPVSEFDQLRDALNSAVMPGEIREISQKIEAAALKLSEGIPARFVPAGKSGEYRAAREQITRQVEINLAGLIVDESIFEAEVAAYEAWVAQNDIDLAAAKLLVSTYAGREILTVRPCPKAQKGKYGCRRANEPDNEVFDKNGYVGTSRWTETFRFGDRALEITHPYDDGVSYKIVLVDNEGNWTQWNDRAVGNQLLSINGSQVYREDYPQAKITGKFSSLDVAYGYLEGEWRVFVVDGATGMIGFVSLDNGLFVNQDNMSMVSKTPAFLDHYLWAGHETFLELQGGTLVFSDNDEFDNKIYPIQYEIDPLTGAYKEILPQFSNEVKFGKPYGTGRSGDDYDKPLPIKRYSETRYLITGFSGQIALFDNGERLILDVKNPRLEADEMPFFDPNGIVVAARASGLFERFVDGGWQALDPKYHRADNLLYYESNGETVFVDAMEMELYRAKGRYLGIDNAFIYVTDEPEK